MDLSKRIGEKLKVTTHGMPAMAYLPKPLPPDPPIDLSYLYSLLDRANNALGRLDAIGAILPDPSLFIYMYVRKEALLSSQIEGTQSSLSDLLLHEDSAAPGVPSDDVEEVSNYIKAMNHGLDRLKEFPLSLRLICEIHKILMAGTRGGEKQPGQFRKSQNWIGGTSPEHAQFVPPPPHLLMDVLGDLEKFFHDATVKLPVLVKAALAHVQFETIHPFLDGNGRVGRLLIAFLLTHEKVLKAPLLYLSLYFKVHRTEYYSHLQRVRDTGEWEVWIEFFLTGVEETATQATQTAANMSQLFAHDRDQLTNAKLATAGTLRIHEYMQKHPVVTTASLTKNLGMSLPTVLRSLDSLEKIEIVKEMSGKKRNRIYAYTQYMSLLSLGTEPLKR